jgi:hypothetical protein
MPDIHRRAMLGVILGGAVAAAVGSALAPDRAEAAPLMMNKDLAPGAENLEAESLVEKAVVVVHTRPVRRRRRVCWWHRGRRVCRWR